MFLEENRSSQEKTQENSPQESLACADLRGKLGQWPLPPRGLELCAGTDGYTSTLVRMHARTHAHTLEGVASSVPDARTHTHSRVCACVRACMRTSVLV